MPEVGFSEVTSAGSPNMNKEFRKRWGGVRRDTLHKAKNTQRPEEND